MMHKKRVWKVTAVLITTLSMIFVLRLWMTNDALASQTSQTSVPTQISYQGYLTDEAGQPINGAAALQFDIYAEASGGASLWQEIHMNVPVKNGYFTVYLGSVTPLEATIFSQPTRYLQVNVNTGTSFVELPRQQFIAVPYALQAEQAEQAAIAAEVAWSGITGMPQNLASGEVWTMQGNSGTDPETHFIGTTDSASLTLAVSGTTALRLEPAVSTGGISAPNVIGGAATNQTANHSYGNVIGGGHSNTTSGDYASVSGGSGNTARTNSTVGGGGRNTANGTSCTIGGGDRNTANGIASTVSGGYFNLAQGNESALYDAATVSGGYHNTASGDTATVSGGYHNTASGTNSIVNGGYHNTASGYFSFAAGTYAHAAHEGAFVWADNQYITYTSTAENQFAIRASGGVTLAMNAGDDKAIQVGERYRDNALIAWGRVRSDAVLSEHFGIVEVSQTTTGQYAITLDAVTEISNGAALIPMAITEIDSQPTSASAVRLVTINQTGPQTFEVYINDGNFNPVNNDFVFMVTGR